MTDSEIVKVLDFWFDDCCANPEKTAGRMGFWFESSEDMDTAICDGFGELVERASAGELDHWAESPQGRLALIILLDQFRRNVHRGAPEAFEKDAVAVDLALKGVEAGMDKNLEPVERSFFYMTLQHSESMDVQDRSAALFDSLIDDVPPEFRDIFRNFAEYAVLHRDIVARFGRFPHRNRILGRENTPEEEDYLSGDAPTFGQ